MSAVTTDAIVKKPETLPLGISHLHGNFYSVPLSSVVLADSGFDHDSDVLVFTNMRYALADYQIGGKGLDKVTMAELEESIRSQGLQNTPICRWHENNSIQAVDCERRIRCLRKLVSANEQCWDKESHNWKSAKELYETVVVQIDELSAFDAYAISFNLGERTVGYGEGSVIRCVKYLRDKNIPESKILELTGYGLPWLTDTDKLIAGTKDDDKLFLALCDEEITREAALKLINEYTDVDKRQKVLFQLKGIAKARFDTRREFAEAQEIESLTKTSPEIMEKPWDESDADSPPIGSGETNIASKGAKKKKVSTKPVVTNTDVKKHQQNSDEPQAPKPLTTTKLEKFWWETVADLVKCNNMNDEDTECEPVDMRDLRLTKLLCEQFKKGEVDIIKILRGFKRKMDKDATK